MPLCLTARAQRLPPHVLQASPLPRRSAAPACHISRHAAFRRLGASASRSAAASQEAAVETQPSGAGAAGEGDATARETGSAEAVERFLSGELCALAYAVRAREMGEGQVATRLQVVEIGCCASSDRPLGLGLPEELAWFDVDLPAEAAAKAQRVLDSGADIADYRTVSPHYKKADFVETLRDHGWSPGVPTIWTVGWLPRWDRRTGDVVLKCITAGARQTPWSALALMVHGPRPRVVDFLGAIGWHRVEVLTPPGGGPVRVVTAWMGRCVDQSG